MRHAFLFLALITGCNGSSDEPNTDETDSAADTGSTTDSGSNGDCSSWLATYDLTGSVFAIDAAFDFDITLQTPYDDPANMGPGTMTLRFPDDAGMTSGDFTIVEYHLTQNFVTGVSGLADVTTDLQTDGADSCGLAAASMAGTTGTWTAPAQMDPVCQNGTISCEGSFCGSNGAPDEGSPIVIDNDCGPSPLSNFEFSSDLSSFTMTATTLSSDSNQTTTMSYVGTLTDSNQDTATPGCFCN